MFSQSRARISKRVKRLKPKWTTFMQKLVKLIDSSSFNVSEDHVAASINVVANIGRTTSKSEIIAILREIGCHDLTERLTLSEVTKLPIARGGLGDVYQGKLDSGDLVAIKCARTHTIETDMDYMQNTAHEIYIWSHCRHDNILDLTGIAQFTGQIAIVSPWMENGVLPDYIRKNPILDRCELCAQVATGLAYLHGAGIVHGDIKGPNVLISNDGTAKLADFGNACLTNYSILFSRLPVYTQSLRWSAPEICGGGEETLYSREGDVYALAMTVLEILTGEVPHSRIREDGRVVFIVAIKHRMPSRPLDVIPTQSRQGDILWSLLERCWVAKPEDRPSANAVRDALAEINPEDLVDQSTISPEHKKIFESLTERGCRNLTSDLDQARCSKIRISAEEPFSHRGILHDGTQVSLRPLVPFVSTSPPSDTQGGRSAAEELSLWATCNHNNVISLLGIATMGNQIMLVYPWSRTTTTTSYLLHNPSANRYQLCLELARGMVYLHSIGLLQRGIDPANIRVFGDGTIALIACSNVALDVHQLQLISSQSGRRRGAPEVNSAMGSYSSKSDIYALGMMLFEIITDQGLLGVFQTVAESTNEDLPTRPNQYIPSDSVYGDRLWHLLTQCWALDPNGRPDASMVVREIEAMDDEGLRAGSKDAVVTELPFDYSAASIIDLVQSVAGHACPVLDVFSVSERPISRGKVFGFYKGKLDNSVAVSAAIREYSGYLGSAEGLSIVKELVQELHAWSKHDHPNILELLGVAEVRGELALMTPWIEGGTMPLFLEATQTDVNTCRMSSQIAEGVAYLHNIGVIHGDVHGGNVWVGENETVKLCNFDSAYMRQSLLHISQDTRPRFSIHWRAPELFEAEDVELNEETDVWALGMTILECITGKFPFGETIEDYAKMRGLIDRNYRPRRPIEQIPLNSSQGDMLWNLLARCWAQDPSERPSAAEVRDTMQTITPQGLIPNDQTVGSAN